MADTIALVGGDTLLGREVRDVLAETLPLSHLRLVASDDDETGKLTELGGEASFLAKLDPDAVEDAAAVILAGTERASREVLGSSPPGRIIDLTYVLEDEPDARLRSPLLADSDEKEDASGPHIVAHPAAIAIAILLHTLHRAFPVTSGLIHIFEPASERGKAGLDELQQQTVNLMSFQPLPKKVFDAQVSFNLLPELGEDSIPKLVDIEERIERHLATLLDRVDGPPMPSLKLIQAPVFHGYSFSAWLQFEEAPSAGDIEEALTGASVDVRVAGMEPPSNVGMAGQSGIAVGAITPDRNNGNAFWLWMAADNLRLGAESAAIVARETL